MNPSPKRRLRRLVLVLATLVGTQIALAQDAGRSNANPALFAGLAQARSSGCGGKPGAATPLRLVGALGEAAQGISRGIPMGEAMKTAGYRALRTQVLNFNGHATAQAVINAVSTSYCDKLLEAASSDIGFFQIGAATWIVLAEGFNPPAESAAAEVGRRVLELINEARAQARTCGDKAFGATGPLKANAVLDNAAMVHAQDMARHSYFSHTGRDGSAPADRATRVGYRWRNVGENIAMGQLTAEQVVQGWIKSPGHCANLMSPDYTEMGIAYSVNMASEGGIYWAQAFGRPR